MWEVKMKGQRTAERETGHKAGNRNESTCDEARRHVSPFQFAALCGRERGKSQGSSFEIPRGMKLKRTGMPGAQNVTTE
jgi:hypothetical protein